MKPKNKLSFNTAFEILSVLYSPSRLNSTQHGFARIWSIRQRTARRSTKIHENGQNIFLSDIYGSIIDVEENGR